MGCTRRHAQLAAHSGARPPAHLALHLHSSRRLGRARLASPHLAVAGAELDRRRCRSCPRLASPPDASATHIFPYPLRFILASSSLGHWYRRDELETKGIWCDNSTPSSAKRAHGIRVSSSRRDKAVQRFWSRLLRLGARAFSVASREDAASVSS